MTGQARQRQNVFEVLIIEDSVSDIRLTDEALKETKVPYNLQVAEDGEQGIQRLRREAPYENTRRPDMILLDWNMPGMDGREVLRTIKQDQDLKDIPVVVLTTSKAEVDVQGAYDLHANCFITKPVNIVQFFEVISAVEKFWLGTATLPGR